MIEPRLLRGLRDYLPAQMIARQALIEKIRRVYERYGFVPIETPAIEDRRILLGEETDASELKIFRFDDPEGRPAGLRFDHTIPLARFVALYPDLPRPFKRYVVGPVWRGDEPAPGRFREFVQFDIDTVGTSSMAADTEIIAIIHDTLVELGLTRFLIRFSNRKILNALMVFLGLDPFWATDIFRTLDKIERVGLEEVKATLTKQGPEGVDQREVPAGARCIGLAPEIADRIMEFVGISGGSPVETIEQLRRFFNGCSAVDEGIVELEQILSGLKAQGIPPERFIIDLSIARGLAYYTGPVFETRLLDLPTWGSVFSGGRFDGLIGRFSETSIPATGASIGVDRLFAALEQLGLVGTAPSKTQVLVTVFDQNQLGVYQQLATELRREGLNTELYMGEETRIGRQFKYADVQRIPIAIVVGPDELSRGEASVKNLRTTFGAAGKQHSVPRDQLISHIRSLLEAVE
ncbi:MAG: histidine--tRNA ligase [Patescibacteria group bacterium]|nr:histidine--tRNA ligase [Patescibacteria group bacterium]